MRTGSLFHRPKSKCDVIHLLPWLTLAISLLLYISFTFSTNAQAFLNSDASSEMMLAKLALDEGSPLVHDWYYSTELRVFHTQMIWAPLFALFSNWSLVRAIGSTIDIVILLSCLYFFCRTLSIRRGFPLLGALIIWPFSDNYMLIVVVHQYYLFAISIGFMMIALFLKSISLMENNKRIALLCAVLGCALSFVAALAGMRTILLMNVPLFLSSVLLFLKDGTNDKHKNIIPLLSALMLLCAGIGYFVNRGVLLQEYAVGDFPLGVWQSFSLDGIENLVEHCLALLGYASEKPAFTVYSVINLSVMLLLGVTLALTAYVVRNKRGLFSKAQQLYALYFASGFFVLFILYSFTTTFLSVRYVIPVMVFAFPLWFVFISKIHALEKGVSIATVLLIVFAMVPSGIVWYKHAFFDTPENPIQEVANYIKESGLKKGYSDFWDGGNLLTELTDGQVEMYVWGSTTEGTNFIDLNQRHRWLQKKTHDSETPTTGSFFLLTDEQIACNEGLAPLIAQSADPVYEVANYKLYLYDDVADALDDDSRVREGA